MRKRDQKTEGYKIEKKVFESKQKPDLNADWIQVYKTIDGQPVLNKTYVLKKDVKPFQLVKP